jgi:hypothetical protein
LSGLFLSAKALTHCGTQASRVPDAKRFAMLLRKLKSGMPATGRPIQAGTVQQEYLKTTEPPDGFSIVMFDACP